MASLGLAKLTIETLDTYLDAVEVQAPSAQCLLELDDILSEHDRQYPPTKDQVYYWRELAGALTLCGSAGMADDQWPVELAPSQATLKALVERRVIVRRSGTWHLRRQWYTRLAALWQIAVATPALSLMERPAPDLPTYTELKHMETICRYLDVLPKSRARLPFAGLSMGTEGEIPITLLRLMRRYRLVRHTAYCEWALSPSWQDRLKQLWQGLHTALREYRPPHLAPSCPRSLVAGVDTWHLNWLVELPLPEALRSRLDGWQERAREDETELETDLVYDGVPLVMYRWGTKPERGNGGAGVSWGYVLLNPSLRLLIRKAPLGGIVAHARLGSECLWRRTPNAALDELTLLMKRLWQGQKGSWQVSQVHLCHDVTNLPLTLELLSRLVSRSRQRAIYEAAPVDVQRVLQARYGDEADDVLAAAIDWDAEFADEKPLSAFTALGYGDVFAEDTEGSDWGLSGSPAAESREQEQLQVEDRASSVYQYGRRLSGLIFSPGGAISVAIYLKRFESVLRHKLHMFPLWKAAGWNEKEEVTRVEARLRRDALRELRLPGVESAILDDPYEMLKHLDGIFGLVVGRGEECPDAINTAWLRLVMPREGESNRSRWDTDPTWQVVQSAPFTAAPVGARRIMRRKQQMHNVEQLTRGSYGYLVSLIAQQSADSEHWDVSRGIRELAEYLTAEAGKPGKDFGELVRSRRKERGLPVEQRDASLPLLPARWTTAGGLRGGGSARTVDSDGECTPWDDEGCGRRPQLRQLATERRMQEAYLLLEEAELRQESASKLAWYEAQYAHELTTYTRLCRQGRGPAQG